MRFKIDDLRKVKINSTKNYMIKRWEYYNDSKDAYKDMHRIYELMKYTIKRNEIFKDISFMVVISTTGKDKQKVTHREKISTKGRPKFKVTGIKKPAHIHIACFGQKCPTFVKVITDKLNKKAYKTAKEFYNRKTNSKRLYTYDKLKGDNYGLDYINYIYNQADKLMTYGQLEFDKMKDTFFIAVDNENF